MELSQMNEDYKRQMWIVCNRTKMHSQRVEASAHFFQCSKLFLQSFDFLQQQLKQSN